MNKDGTPRKTNPDRSRWKESMRARRERLAAQQPPLLFVCTAKCFAAERMVPARLKGQPEDTK